MTALASRTASATAVSARRRRARTAPAPSAVATPRRAYRRRPTRPPGAVPAGQRHQLPDVDERATATTSAPSTQDARVHGALVVERPCREVRAQAHAAGSRTRIPTSGARRSSRSGDAPIAIGQRRGRRAGRPSRRVRRNRSASACRSAVGAAVPRARGWRRRAARDRSPRPRQPILVVHRRLVHEVRQALVAVRATMTEEDDAPSRTIARVT